MGIEIGKKTVKIKKKNKSYLKLYRKTKKSLVPINGKVSELMLNSERAEYESCGVGKCGSVYPVSHQT